MSTHIRAAFLIAVVAYGPLTAAGSPVVDPDRSYEGGAAAGSPGRAEEPVPLRNDLAFLDGAVIGLSLGYAHRVSPHWFLGLGAGFLGDIGERMIVAGRHYSEYGGWSFGGHDGNRDKHLWELAHVRAIALYEVSTHVHIETGGRVSCLAHWDSSDDEAGGLLFIGAYACPMVGWRTFKMGPTIRAGLFTGCGNSSEFGIHISALTARVMMAW